MIEWGACGHPLGPRGKCRVCPLNPQDDRDSNPVGEHRLAWFYGGDGDNQCLPGEWWNERQEWRGREDEANRIDLPQIATRSAPGPVIELKGEDSYRLTWPGWSYAEVERTVRRICPPKSRGHGKTIIIDDMIGTVDPESRFDRPNIRRTLVYQSQSLTRGDHLGRRL